VLLGLALTAAACTDLLEPVNPDPGVGEPGFERAFPAPPPEDRLPAEPVHADKSPVAISGGTLSIAPDGKFAVASDPDRDRVYVVNLETQAVHPVQLARGAEPGRVVVDRDGVAHVSLRSGGELVAIDVDHARVLRSAAVCQHPRGLALNADDTRVLVACAEGVLVTVRKETYEEVVRAFIDHDLRDVVVSKSGRTWVSRYRSAELIEVSDWGLELGRRDPASLRGTRFTVDEFGYEHAQDVTLRPRLAWRTTLSTTGEPVMIHQRSQEEEVVPGPGGYGGGCSSVTEATVTEMTEDASPQATWGLSSATLAVDVAISPRGPWLAVASPGSHLLGQVGTVQLFTTTDVLQPAWDLDNCGFSSAAQGDYEQVTAVAFDSVGRLYAQSREPASLLIFEVIEHREVWGVDENGDEQAYVWPELSLVTRISLSTESARDTGHDLFHSNVGAGVACASCHGEALDDGHTWTFQDIGPRRTQNMRGGLRGTEPFHWDGDMATFKHLVDEVMTGRMGGFEVYDAWGESPQRLRAASRSSTRPTSVAGAVTGARSSPTMRAWTSAREARSRCLRSPGSGYARRSCTTGAPARFASASTRRAAGAIDTVTRHSSRTPRSRISPPTWRRSEACSPAPASHTSGKGPSERAVSTERVSAARVARPVTFWTLA
jgi:hypothetical protein